MYTNEYLVQEIQAGINKDDNMNLLYYQNKTLIYQTIKPLARSKDDIKDLLQESFIALCECIPKYDPAKGVPFISYALKIIKGHCIKYVKTCGGPISLPLGLTSELMRLDRFCITFYSVAGREPTMQEITAGTGYPAPHIKKLQQLKNDLQTVSLDALVEADETGETTLKELVPDTAPGIEEHISAMDREQNAATVWNVVQELPKDQAQIITARYKSDEPLTAAETARACHCTESDVNKACKNGFKALRRVPRMLQCADNYGIAWTQKIYTWGIEKYNRTGMSGTEYAAISIADGEEPF